MQPHQPRLPPAAKTAVILSVPHGLAACHPRPVRGSAGKMKVFMSDAESGLLAARVFGVGAVADPVLSGGSAATVGPAGVGPTVLTDPA